MSYDKQHRDKTKLLVKNVLPALPRTLGSSEAFSHSEELWSELPELTAVISASANTQQQHTNMVCKSQDMHILETIRVQLKSHPSMSSKILSMWSFKCIVNGFLLQQGREKVFSCGSRGGAADGTMVQLPE